MLTFHAQRLSGLTRFLTDTGGVQETQQQFNRTGRLCNTMHVQFASQRVVQF